MKPPPNWEGLVLEQKREATRQTTCAKRAAGILTGSCTLEDTSYHGTPSDADIETEMRTYLGTALDQGPAQWTPRYHDQH